MTEQATGGGAIDRVQRLQMAVAQVMSIEDTTRGGPENEYAVRFRGRLIGSSEDAYERLAPQFRQEGMTLLFREQESRHVVLGVPGVISPEPSNPMVNAVLFILTVISVVISGALIANVDFYGNDFIPTLPNSLAGYLDLLSGGVPFAVALLAILLAHEFGHYLAGRFHRTAVTLPYFLPFPGSILGTLGAFIRMKEPPKNRSVLLDIGLAGPLAGFLVAVPVLWVGISLSEITALPANPQAAAGFTLEGNSLLYLLIKYLIKGELLPAPSSYGDVSVAAYWFRYFFLSSPVPFGGRDILVHPLAWAGWAGLLVTALNLIPAGQLDGGHLVYVLLGRRARTLWPLIVVGLVALGFVWSGWWIWAGLIFFLGRSYAEPLDAITPLDARRQMLALLGLVIFLLTFTPVPLIGPFG